MYFKSMLRVNEGVPDLDLLLKMKRLLLTTVGVIVVELSHLMAV